MICEAVKNIVREANLLVHYNWVSSWDRISWGGLCHFYFEKIFTDDSETELIKLFQVISKKKKKFHIELSYKRRTYFKVTEITEQRQSLGAWKGPHGGLFLQPAFWPLFVSACQHHSPLYFEASIHCFLASQFALFVFEEAVRLIPESLSTDSKFLG